LKNSFYLVIPSQQNDHGRLKEFETKALQQWIAELPTANPGLATRLIHDFLQEINTIEMPVQLRLEALEILRASVFVVEDYLRARLIKTGFPKDDNQKKIFSILVEVEKEFTTGYWIALKELTRRDIGWFQGKNAALSIQRTIKGLSSIIISYFIMGMPIPDWVWIDLHSLYKLSVNVKKNTTNVANNVSGANKASTPQECYQQILLLSLVDPAGLMQKEILLVYSFIETIAPLITLKKEPVPDQPVQCIIMIDEDKPPHYVLEADVKTDPGIIYINFTKLYKALDRKKKLISESDARFSSMYVLKNAREKPSAELLDYLKRKWLNAVVQEEPLFKDRLDRYVAIGLASTYDVLVSLDDGSQKDIEFLAQSASDKLLSCEFKKTGVLSVGSLVSFRKTELPPYQRCLGVVDKVVVEKNGKFYFGMRLLALQIYAVSYMQANAAEHEAPKKGLFYKTKEQEEGYLITDTSGLKNDDVIRLSMNNENFPVALKNRKNIGAGYWQFECVRVIENTKRQQPKKGFDFI
jgi:cyclic-di-GMP-binding protein